MLSGLNDGIVQPVIHRKATLFGDAELELLVANELL